MTRPSKKPIRPDILIDSDILIQTIIGDQSIKEQINSIDPNRLFISKVTVIEFFFNINSHSTKEMESLVKRITIIPLSELVGEVALYLVKSYPKRLRAAESMIAAIARLYNLQHYTNNLPDFTGIAGLNLYKPAIFKP